MLFPPSLLQQTATYCCISWKRCWCLCLRLAAVYRACIPCFPGQSARHTPYLMTGTAPQELGTATTSCKTTAVLPAPLPHSTIKIANKAAATMPHSQSVTHAGHLGQVSCSLHISLREVSLLRVSHRSQPLLLLLATI